MSTDVNCRRCGAALARDGSCPRCELGLAFSQSPGGMDLPAEQGEPFKRFGDYELLEELGHGGMGVVYRAEQVKLKRVVALKLLLLGPYSSPQSIKRFEREAQATAALHHPNIVSVYDVGEVEGQPYLAMEYVEGCNLAVKLRAGPFAPRQTASYCRAIAEAINAAHTTGIIHRDLKPSNILIDIFDQPRITDFGLAKWMGLAAGVESDVTVSGQILGSPNYLAPEIASGQLHQAGPSADIYAIGALLYECLTGRPPFFAATLQETLIRVRDTEPVGIRTLNGSVPRDLETICLKCLDKEPNKRYETAGELSDELGRFLQGQPVQARPLPVAAKAWRWCRRKPVVASLAAALVLVIGLGLAGVLWEWRRAVAERLRAEAGELDARQRQYASDMDQVQNAWDEGNLPRARQLLDWYLPKPGKPDQRGFEWRYLSALCQEQSRVACTNFQNDLGLVAFVPGAQALAVADGAEIKFLSANLRTELGELHTQADHEPISKIAFAAANTNILATLGDSGTVRVWDLAQRSSEMFQRNLVDPTAALALSPDGCRLAIASNCVLSVWSVLPKGICWTQSLKRPVRAVAFGPDGLSLVSGGGENNGNALVWRLQDGESLDPFPTLHKGWMEQIVFSPDGKTMASCADDDKLILWDFARRQPKSERLRHAGNGLAFSPDGRYIATLGYDLILRVREVPTQREVALLRTLNYSWSFCFAPDNRTILMAGSDRALHAWDALGSEDRNLLTAHSGWVHGVALSADAKRLVSVDAQDYSLVWDVENRRNISLLSGDGFYGGGAVFSPTGDLLVTSSYSGKIKLWDPLTLAARGELTNSYGVSSLAFSGDGRFLAASTGYIMNRPDTNALFVWDIAKREQIHRFTQAARDATVVAFSHDGRSLAVGSFDGSVRLWDWETGRLMVKSHDFEGQVMGVAFSPNDACVAAASLASEQVLVYRRGDLHVLAQLDGHRGGVRCLAFAPGANSTLAVGGNDNVIHLWSMTSYQLVLVLKQHTAGVMGLSFDKSGFLMASCDGDGGVRLWPAPMPPEPAHARVNAR